MAQSSPAPVTVDPDQDVSSWVRSLYSDEPKATLMINWLTEQGFKKVKDLSLVTKEDLESADLGKMNDVAQKFVLIVKNSILALGAKPLDNHPNKEHMSVETLRMQQKAKTELNTYLYGEDAEDDTKLIGQIKVAMLKHWGEVPQSGKTAQEFCQDLVPKIMTDIQGNLQLKFDQIYTDILTEWCNGIKSLTKERIVFRLGDGWWGSTPGEITHLVLNLVAFTIPSLILTKLGLKAMDVMAEVKVNSTIKELLEAQKKQSQKILELEEANPDTAAARAECQAKITEIDEKIGRIEAAGPWKAGWKTEIALGTLSTIIVGVALFFLEKYVFGPWMEKAWSEEDVKKNLPGQLRDAIVASRSTNTLIQAFDDVLFDTFMQVIKDSVA